MKWIEVADGVLARRYPELDQTLGLIVGGERCLVVDTGTDEVHGAELAAAVREVTTLPWTVLITHAHWDHFFGTASFGSSPVLAHPRCRDEIATNAEDHRERGMRHFRAEGRHELAERLASARVAVPTEPLGDRVELDLGGRPVTLLHPGLGHTGGDVVAYVPDAGVLLAGDLVEQGAPPAYGSDAYPLEWPSTVDTLLRLEPRLVVPGHGDPVDRDFVAGQRDELAVIAELFRLVRSGELAVDEALPRSPYPDGYTRPALVAGRVSAGWT